MLLEYENSLKETAKQTQHNAEYSISFSEDTNQTIDSNESKEKNLEQIKVEESQASEHNTDESESDLDGFDLGLQAEKILGASSSQDELMFLIKWLDSDKTEWVYSKVANVKCPQIVIEFYQQHLKWKSRINPKSA